MPRKIMKKQYTSPCRPVGHYPPEVGPGNFILRQYGSAEAYEGALHQTFTGKWG